MILCEIKSEQTRHKENLRQKDTRVFTHNKYAREYTLFYENILYKNIEAEIGEI